MLEIPFDKAMQMIEDGEIRDAKQSCYCNMQA